MQTLRCPAEEKIACRIYVSQQLRRRAAVEFAAWTRFHDPLRSAPVTVVVVCKDRIGRRGMALRAGVDADCSAQEKVLGNPACRDQALVMVIKRMSTGTLGTRIPAENRNTTGYAIHSMSRSCYRLVVLRHSSSGQGALVKIGFIQTALEEVPAAV